MEITLKNGDKKHFDKAASCKDIALSISEGLARAAVCALKSSSGTYVFNKSGNASIRSSEYAI